MERSFERLTGECQIVGNKPMDHGFGVQSALRPVLELNTGSSLIVPPPEPMTGGSLINDACLSVSQD